MRADDIPLLAHPMPKEILEAFEREEREAWREIRKRIREGGLRLVWNRVERPPLP